MVCPGQTSSERHHLTPHGGITLKYGTPGMDDLAEDEMVEKALRWDPASVSPRGTSSGHGDSHLQYQLLTQEAGVV